MGNARASGLGAVPVKSTQTMELQPAGEKYIYRVASQKFPLRFLRCELDPLVSHWLFSRPHLCTLRLAIIPFTHTEICNNPIYTH